MINRQKFLLTAIAIAGVFASMAPAAATKLEQVGLQKEIASCVAEVGNHANYGDASRVRHEIVVSKRRTIGHKLTIDTSIYAEGSEQAIRAYATKCVVYRDNKPVRFTISESDAGA